MIIVEDPESGESVKIELHRRGEDVRLLGTDIMEGVPLLSDEDILGEKLYYARCTQRDVYDIEFILKRVKDPLGILRRKYKEPLNSILLRIRRNCPKVYKLL